MRDVEHSSTCESQVKPQFFKEVKTALERSLQGVLLAAEAVDREDLELANHLSGLKRTFMKLTFRNAEDMRNARGR